jgi:hypothetical protein
MVCCPLVYFSSFGMFAPIKIWQPWRENQVDLEFQAFCIWQTSGFSLNDVCSPIKREFLAAALISGPRAISQKTN